MAEEIINKIRSIQSAHGYVPHSCMSSNILGNDIARDIANLRYVDLEDLHKRAGETELPKYFVDAIEFEYRRRSGDSKPQ